MIVIGKNLEQLIKMYNIIDRASGFDETCLTLTLGDALKYIIPNEKNKILIYGRSIPNDVIIEKNISEDGFVLQPHSSVLVCSSEYVKMPLGYMGLIQTKGSLARLFVMVTFSDGQVDPGYNGKVTLELFNGSEFGILLHRKDAIANLYVIKTSTKNSSAYSGKYQNSNKPTLPKFE